MAHKLLPFVCLRCRHEGCLGMEAGCFLMRGGVGVVGQQKVSKKEVGYGMEVGFQTGCFAGLRVGRMAALREEEEERGSWWNVIISLVFGGIFLLKCIIQKAIFGQNFNYDIIIE